MLGAIYIGLSGMDAYSKGLQIISNNVANLNTPGFKATNVQFSDLFDGSGGAGLTYLGSSFSQDEGGEGVQVGKSLLDFGEGTLTQTDNDLDLAIQGAGFLVLLNGNQQLYTRTGSFAVDKDGFITESSTGYRLAVLDSNGQPVAVNVNDKKTNPPVATSNVTLTGNIDSGGGPLTTQNFTVYDDLGAAHTMTVGFQKDAAAGQTGEWDVAINDGGSPLDVSDANGVPLATPTLTFVGGALDTTQTENPKMTAQITDANGESRTVTFDFSQLTSDSGQGTQAAATTIDGNASGDLSTVTIDSTGQVLLTYSNTKTVQDGAVAIADFRDLQGLEQLSQGIFQDNGAGQRRLLASGQDGIGTLESKQLEASNVDLSAQFGELILVQRGFQACSQVVSVSNDMIQQLFGIRGQG